MSGASLPRPPRTVADAEGREIALRAYDGGEAERNALVAMYADFDPADRAQGIPPMGETKVREWLDTLLGGESVNVIAWHDESVVGHATLVADGDREYELAIFVDQSYQGAGIGTQLLRTLLGYGAEHGVEHVWLTVERWNHPAIALYERVGFETASSESFEIEMERTLD